MAYMTSDPLDELQRKIDEIKPAPASQNAEPEFLQKDMGKAMRLGVELLAGIIVGVALGYFLDRWLGTAPLFLIVCFFFGAAAGFRNLVRSANN